MHATGWGQAKSSALTSFFTQSMYHTPDKSHFIYLHEFQCLCWHKSTLQRKHTEAAHFVIVCSSESQVIVLNFNFNMFCGSLLMSPQALWRLKRKKSNITLSATTRNCLFLSLLSIQETTQNDGSQPMGQTALHRSQLFITVAKLQLWSSNERIIWLGSSQHEELY